MYMDFDFLFCFFLLCCTFDILAEMMTARCLENLIALYTRTDVEIRQQAL